MGELRLRRVRNSILFVTGGLTIWLYLGVPLPVRGPLLRLCDVYASFLVLRVVAHDHTVRPTCTWVNLGRLLTNWMKTWLTWRPYKHRGHIGMYLGHYYTDPGAVWETLKKFRISLPSTSFYLHSDHLYSEH